MSECGHAREGSCAKCTPARETADTWRERSTMAIGRALWMLVGLESHRAKLVAQAIVDAIETRPIDGEDITINFNAPAMPRGKP